MVQEVKIGSGIPAKSGKMVVQTSKYQIMCCKLQYGMNYIVILNIKLNLCETGNCELCWSFEAK